ncbi:unnamed protein product [Urochloa decumbens]|uniref:Uncharacterized protein n=1 Tax=Urochloa decumbens TaxID=240449 RepID=A0ABC8ZZY7_9POAL
MMNVVASHPQNLKLPLQDVSPRPRGRPFISNKAKFSRPSAARCTHTRRFTVVRAAGDDRGGESSSGGGGQDDDEEQQADATPRSSSKGDNFSTSSGAGGGMSREDLERLVGPDDDDKFNGLDLANLIRKKYGRSYDVTLIKKEFMGRNLLAMNVMWKYREQRSFPLSEEEYLLRLDEVANTLRCWGAVAHVRNTLEKLKERPRIGKAVSIFIDMDQTGGRANEWIYK